MTLASLHQVLTLRMSPSPRHPSASPHGCQQPARPSCLLHPGPLESHSPLHSSPSSASASASAPGPSLHLLGRCEGTYPHGTAVRLPRMCAASAQVPHGACACLAHRACGTSALRRSHAGAVSALWQMTGWLGCLERASGEGFGPAGAAGAGAWIALHIVEAFLGGKAPLAPPLPPTPLCPAHPGALAGSLVSLW